MGAQLGFQYGFRGTFGGEAAHAAGETGQPVELAFEDIELAIGAEIGGDGQKAPLFGDGEGAFPLPLARSRLAQAPDRDRLAAFQPSLGQGVKRAVGRNGQSLQRRIGRQFAEGRGLGQVFGGAIKARIAQHARRPLKADIGGAVGGDGEALAIGAARAQRRIARAFQQVQRGRLDRRDAPPGIAGKAPGGEGPAIRQRGETGAIRREFDGGHAAQARVGRAPTGCAQIFRRGQRKGRPDAQNYGAERTEAHWAGRSAMVYWRGWRFLGASGSTGCLPGFGGFR